MDLIKKLRERREALMKRMRELTDKAESEDRAKLDEAENTEYEAAKADIEALDVRIADLVADEEERSAAAAAEQRINRPSDVQVGDEPRTYTREAERRNGVSFLRDVMNQGRDPHAAQRLQRHVEETEALVPEARDVGTGAFAGLVVPQYLTDLVAPVRRAGRPTANIANGHDLPPDGMTVNISRITTGTAVLSQATENTGVQETDADDTLLTVNVRTIAGMQDVSRQAIDRGTGVDAIVIEDLQKAYNTELNRQIINTDGTSGTHLGIRSTAGIIAVTYTDATPTAPEMFPKFADLIQQVQAAIYMGVSHFVMAPRRWWWWTKELSTSMALMGFPGTAPQQVGNSGETSYESNDGRNIMGVPVVLDGTIPTNLGAGTNEDVILGVTAPELHLWEDPAAPLFIRSEEVLANQLSVRFVLYGYSAFTAGRYPAAHGTISGTGLITPTF